MPNSFIRDSFWRRQFQVGILIFSLFVCECASAFQVTSTPPQPATRHKMKTVPPTSVLDNKATTADINGPDIDTTVSYLNQLLDSGFGAKRADYTFGHIFVDKDKKMIWYGRLGGGCPGGFWQLAFFGFRAGEIALSWIQKTEDDTGWTGILINCAGKSYENRDKCTQVWTACADGQLPLGFATGTQFHIEKKALTRLEGTLQGIDIGTSGDSEDNVRFIKAMRHLIALVRNLPSQDSTDPFSK